MMLAESKAMLSVFNDFEISTDGKKLDCVSSFKYLGVILDEKSELPIQTLIVSLGFLWKQLNAFQNRFERKIKGKTDLG